MDTKHAYMTIVAYEMTQNNTTNKVHFMHSRD